jgi:hypothetical protein
MLFENPLNTEDRGSIYMFGVTGNNGFARAVAVMGIFWAKPELSNPIEDTPADFSPERAADDCCKDGGRPPVLAFMGALDVACRNPSVTVAFNV